jgi:shikimate kinase
MKIFLIGLPGSGKSTLGKDLADALLVDFIDLDIEIEKQENKIVQDIFREKGEDYFRQVESSVLKIWASSSKSFVMSTGGGAPCFYGGIDVINESGISIFLDVPVDEILRRLSASKNRPLLESADEREKFEKLNALYAQRLATYQKATISILNPTVEKLHEAVRIKKRTQP